MKENTHELLFSSSNRSLSRRISMLLSAGKIRKLMPRVYTSDLTASPEQIVSRNLFFILAKIFPGGIMSHRTALEGKPGPDGVVFITYHYTRKIKIPGHTVRLLHGPDPLVDDMPFAGGLFMSSLARAYLENMQRNRARTTGPKCLPVGEIEQRLDRWVQIRGEDELNRLRDRTRDIAAQLDMREEFGRLDAIVSSLLGTRPGHKPRSAAGLARSLGAPFDHNRLALFNALFAHLRQTPVPLIKTEADTAGARMNRAFFESYFSNFIEGTEFDLAVARDIIFNNFIPPARPRDAHDIIGTFRVVSDDAEMAKVPASAPQLFELLQARHSRIMEARPEALPGEFKLDVNRAGQTTFVAPELVRGTLMRGMELYPALEPGMSRAVYMLFLVSEVHPFTDGNGRIARIMMNAELAAAGLSSVIVPIVYRDNYIQALRALSRSTNPVPLVRVLSYAWRFTALIDFSDFETARQAMERCNAFSDDEHARLLLPPGQHRPLA